MVAHIFIIVLFDVRWKMYPLWSIWLLLPGIFLIGKMVPKITCQGPAQGFIIAYFALLQVTYAASIAQLCGADTFKIGHLLSSLGYLMFLVSDSYLFAHEFGLHDDPKRLELMGSYVLAQGFLGVGLGLTH
jgi:hypothetical protein